MTNDSFICKMLGGDDKLKMNNDKTPEYHYSNLILRVFRKKQSNHPQKYSQVFSVLHLKSCWEGNIN